MWSESAPLTRRYSATPWQCHVLGVPPRHRLHRSVQPEGLSDAHGGEGKVRQILPLDKHTQTHAYIINTRPSTTLNCSAFFFFLTTPLCVLLVLASAPSLPACISPGSGRGAPGCTASSKWRWPLCRDLWRKQSEGFQLILKGGQTSVALRSLTCEHEGVGLSLDLLVCQALSVLILQ